MCLSTAFLAPTAAAQGGPAATASPAAKPPAVAPVAAPTAPPAPTPDQIARAKTLFDLGAKAYDSEQFPAAIQAFQEAYRLSQRPGPIFSTAQAYRRLYNTDRSVAMLRQAVTFYKEYIDKQKSGGRIAEAQQALRDLEPVLAQLAAAPAGTLPLSPTTVATDMKPRTRLMVSSATKGATASVDGAEPAEMPLIQELPLGPHTLRVTAEGYVDDEREILAAEGQVYGLDIALRERPAILTVRTDAGAELTVDGRSEGIAPFRKPLELSSGSHLITITRRGHQPYSADIELRRDEKRALDVSLPRTDQRHVAFGALGVAAVGAIAGGILTGLAFHEQDVAREIEERKKQQNLTEDERRTHEEAVANREDLKMAAASGFAASGVFALLAVGLYAFDHPAPGLPVKLRDDAAKKPAEAKRAPKLDASVTPILGPTGGGAVVRFRF